MRMESRFRYVLAAFGEPIPTAVQGAIFRSPAPIDLAASLGPVVARRLVAERNEPLLEFGTARTVPGGAALLGLLRVGRTGAVACVVLPCQAPFAVAALRPAAEPSLVSAFLLSFLAKNGATFGIDFLHILPPWIRNWRPDVLDRGAVHKALQAWMAWAERNEVSSWKAMRAHVLDRSGRRDWVETLSSVERRELLEMYLTTSYFELGNVSQRTVDAEGE